MLTEGGGGVQEPLILAEVICEQPLTVILICLCQRFGKNFHSQIEMSDLTNPRLLVLKEFSQNYWEILEISPAGTRCSAVISEEMETKIIIKTRTSSTTLQNIIMTARGYS